MKTLCQFALVLLALFLGCNGKTAATLQHTHADGKVKVNVTASRSMAIEAWKVEMKVKAYNFKEGQLAFEIYADDLTAENVLFNWTDETHCTIVFKQSDGKDRTFSLVASPSQLEMFGM